MSYRVFAHGTLYSNQRTISLPSFHHVPSSHYCAFPDMWKPFESRFVFSLAQDQSSTRWQSCNIAEPLRSVPKTSVVGSGASGVAMIPNSVGAVTLVSTLNPLNLNNTSTSSAPNARYAAQVRHDLSWPSLSMRFIRMAIVLLQRLTLPPTSITTQRSLLWAGGYRVAE